MLTTAVLVLAMVEAVPTLSPLVGSDGVDPPAVVFLDVGQGDSILVLGTGLTILIDGGPDPRTLAEKLRKYRVRKVDLVVITHPHADHVRGLEAVVGQIRVGGVWDASHPMRPLLTECSGTVSRRKGYRFIDPLRAWWYGMEN